MPDIHRATERAYQKQSTIFQNEKSPAWRNWQGEAPTILQNIKGTYTYKKCPFPGNISVRAQILSGVVDYVHYIQKYHHLEKHHKNKSIGDMVTVGECRPLSKTVCFNVLKVTKATGTRKQFRNSETRHLSTPTKENSLFSPVKKKKKKKSLWKDDRCSQSNF
ncbi:unnamed protein product [Nyctereutes procyonoides]|uniref:Small ribosomal subunit protein uS17 n=1 Tax=Nyctereutes procyonoides TaxID=34880 RepID=A0A811YZT2_NYCPR|nr:unnamed protein product [Nyctereutes procyonoides]